MPIPAVNRVVAACTDGAEPATPASAAPRAPSPTAILRECTATIPLSKVIAILAENPPAPSSIETASFITATIQRISPAQIRIKLIWVSPALAASKGIILPISLGNAFSSTLVL